jgi:hypothetical protein
MRVVAIGIMSLALIGPAVQSAMAEGSCVQAVQELQAKWQAVGYPMPTKQTQASITSLDGQHHASAAEVNYLRVLIRAAGQECEKGDQAASLQHVALVQGALGTPATTSVAAKQGQ